MLRAIAWSSIVLAVAARAAPPVDLDDALARARATKRWDEALPIMEKALAGPDAAKAARAFEEAQVLSPALVLDRADRQADDPLEIARNLYR